MVRNLLGLDARSLVALVAVPESVLDRMSRQVLLFLHFFVVMMPLAVMVMPVQMVRDGPIGLEFPAAQRLRQGNVTDPYGLPVPLGEDRVRYARG